MRRPPLRLLVGWCLIILLGLLTGIPVQASMGTDWLTRGKDDDRSQATNEAMGPIAATQIWTAANTGATGSQPLLVGDRIYHIAGRDLWQISSIGQKQSLLSYINMVQDASGGWSVRPSTSGITYVEIAGFPVLFFGTGDNKVCAYRLPDKTFRCLALTAATTEEPPIVTVPLVFETEVDGRLSDIVVMGDKRGRIWVIQDLISAPSQNDVTSYSEYVGGWILASPVAVRDGNLDFVWGNDLGDHGLIGAYRITPRDSTHPLAVAKAWEDIRTTGGVADGFARADNFVYASTTSGVTYKVDATKGTHSEVNLAAGPVFANASPAYDDKHVYFAIRNVGTPNPSTTAPGRLVALDRETFQLAWTANLPAPANTNPLVWTQGPNVVLVGDTRGVLHAFDRNTGAPSPFGVTITDTVSQGRHICTPLTDLDLGTPGQAGQAYQTLTGVSEPILASGSTGEGLLLVGVSGLNPQGELDGQLRAFKAGGAYNISVAPAEQPAQALAVGQPYTFTANLTLHPWGPTPAEPRATGVAAYWVPADSNTTARQIGSTTVTLTPEQPAPVTFTFTPTEADGTEGALKLYANPEQLIFSSTDQGQELRNVLGKVDGTNYQVTDTPHLIQTVAGAQWPGNCQQAETELLPEGYAAAMADNVLSVSVAIQQAVDLSVHGLSAPGALACDMGTPYIVSWSVTNPSSRTQTEVPWALMADGRKVSWGTTDLAPGETPRSVHIPIMACGRTTSLRIEVNLGPEPRPVKEPDYSNNAAATSVNVAAAAVVTGGFAEEGSEHTLIVPDDCEANPNPTSPQPCLNYPNLLLP